MRCIYWIEDESNLLRGVREALMDLSVIDEIRDVNDATDALQKIGAIEGAKATIIFDLWIPPGASPAAYQPGIGPEIGLFVLQRLRANLGKEWPIFIVSGNLTRGIRERLVAEFAIPIERIFSKPLNEQRDRLVEGIRASLEYTTPAPLAGGMPPVGRAAGEGR